MGLPLGFFDEYALPLGWFDGTSQPEGWFSFDFLDAEEEGGGGGGGGGNPPPSQGGFGGGPGTYTLPAGLTLKQKKAMAALLACAPCCLGSGSGSGSGVPFPNGCVTCDCRPCICYWYTEWHKSITVDSLLIPYGGTGWTLVSQTLAKIGGNPDYMYLAVTENTACIISGLFAVDGNNDITDSLTYIPKWSGEMVYTNGVDTVTFDVVAELNFQINLGCDEPAVLADSVVWFSVETATSDPPGYTFNGSNIFDGITSTVVDIGLPNDIFPGDGTITDGGGTLDMGYSLPPLTITPMRQPGCVG